MMDGTNTTHNIELWFCKYDMNALCIFYMIDYLVYEACLLLSQGFIRMWFVVSLPLVCVSVTANSIFFVIPPSLIVREFSFVKKTSSSSLSSGFFLLLGALRLCIRLLPPIVTSSEGELECAPYGPSELRLCGRNLL